MKVALAHIENGKITFTGKGQEAGIASDNPRELAELVLQKKLPFDQMILYDTFVHISHKHSGPQRGAMLYDAWNEGEKVNNSLKKNFDTLCEEFGFTTTAAITVFMKTVVRERKITPKAGKQS